jgi:hypothetical protein
LLAYLLRPPQRGLHVAANILRSLHFFEIRLMNQAGGLLACATEDQGSIARMQMAGDFLDRE